MSYTDIRYSYKYFLNWSIHSSNSGRPVAIHSLHTHSDEVPAAQSCPCLEAPNYLQSYVHLGLFSQRNIIKSTAEMPLIWVYTMELHFINCYPLQVFSTKAHKEKKKPEKIKFFIHWCNFLSQSAHFSWHTVIYYVMVTCSWTHFP